MFSCEEVETREREEGGGRREREDGAERGGERGKETERGGRESVQKAHYLM